MEMLIIKPYRVTSRDTKVSHLAKKAAMICVSAISNPLHVSFEDGNFRPGKNMDFERECNRSGREKNGELMYSFISEFLDEADSLSEDEQREMYRLFREKWSYLGNKWVKLIAAHSKPEPVHSGIAYRHYPGKDGHIYVETDLGVIIRQF